MQISYVSELRYEMRYIFVECGKPVDSSVYPVNVPPVFDLTSTQNVVAGLNRTSAHLIW